MNLLGYQKEKWSVPIARQIQEGQCYIRSSSMQSHIQLKQSFQYPVLVDQGALEPCT